MNVPTETPNRDRYIGNLKIIMISIVILDHMMLAFGCPGRWYMKDVTHIDKATKSIFILYHGVMHTFLTPFFFVSGLFTGRSVTIRALGDFLKKRLIRLAIPLVIYDAVIHPLLIIAVIVAITFLVREIPAHPLVKLVFAFPAAVVVSFACALCLRKVKLLRKAL